MHVSCLFFFFFFSITRCALIRACALIRMNMVFEHIELIKVKKNINSNQKRNMRLVQFYHHILPAFVCLFDLWLNVLVNSNGHIRMSPFYGTSTLHKDVMTSKICLSIKK